MNFSSWLPQSLSMKKKKKNKPEPSTSPLPTTSILHKPAKEEDEEEEFGMTKQLKDFVKSFTVDTFKNFPLQDDQGTTINASPATSANVRKDLSEWQEQHATLVLTKVKEISQLRYVLCPRHLKEREFWRRYFMLVKSYVSPYEMRAIQQAKLKRMEMGMEDEKSLDTSSCEVEMAETKRAMIVSPCSSPEHDLCTPLGRGES